MKIKVCEIPRNFCGIYKINFPNGKIYIGQSVDIKRRMWEHNNPNENKTPCDNAINKYGKIDEIEILEKCHVKELEEKEIYWIKYYNSINKNIGYNLSKGGLHQSGENNSVSVFSNYQVLDIRRRRYLGERKRDVYKDYQNYSFATFERVWLGRGYPEIGQEYLIPANTIDIKELSSKINSGVNSAKAKFNKEEILDIRNKYDNEQMTISEIHKIYNHVNISTIRRIVERQTYKNI